MASPDVHFMRGGNFEYFTRQTSLLTPAVPKDGRMQWPNEIKRMAQLIPDVLPAWVVSVHCVSTLCDQCVLFFTDT